MPAFELFFVGGRGGSLADRRAVDGDVGIGSGLLGKVCAFMYHGTAVAVKELKTGALDAASIGMCRFLMSKSSALSVVGVW